MNSVDRIEQLQREIEKERRNIQTCMHEFGEPYFNPEKYRRPYGSHTVLNDPDMKEALGLDNDDDEEKPD